GRKACPSVRRQRCDDEERWEAPPVGHQVPAGGGAERNPRNCFVLHRKLAVSEPGRQDLDDAEGPGRRRYGLERHHIRIELHRVRDPGPGVVLRRRARRAVGDEGRRPHLVGDLTPAVSSRTGDLDEGAIRAFVQEDYRRVVNGLAVMCGSRTAAEDAVQEALARAWERSGRGERIDDLAAWVTIVARNVLRSGFRRLRIERRVRAAFDQPAEWLGGTGMTEDHVDVMRALAGLTAIQRETTVLHYYLGLPVAD